MKMIVADDELLARETMVGILEDIRPVGLQIAEAGSGQELIDLARQWKPDIAFVDIRMPGKSGLEAIKEASAFTPDTLWVMITGFAEFEYAKEALQLGAIDYLLKPVDPDAVERILLKADAKAGQDCKSQCREFEAQMVYMFHDRNAKWPVDEWIPGQSESWLGVIIYQDHPDYEETEPSGSPDASLYQAIRERLATHCSKELRLALVRLSSREHIVIGNAFSPGSKSSMIQLLHSIREQSLLPAPESRRILFTLLDCGEHHSFGEFQAEVIKLRTLSNLRSVTGNSRAWTLRDLETYDAQPFYSTMSTAAVRLTEAYRDSDYVSFMNGCEKLQSHWVNTPKKPPGLEDDLVRFLECSIGGDWPSAADRTSWLEILPQMAGSWLLARKSEAEPGRQDLIASVIEYIEANYCGDVTVAGVAERFQISPNHLSTLFRKKTGVTFVQYLTRLRMLKAQELLANPAVKVNEAAEQVGYFSTRHFTNLFKEYTGCYPSEFSRKHP